MIKKNGNEIKSMKYNKNRLSSRIAQYLSSIIVVSLHGMMASL